MFQVLDDFLEIEQAHLSGLLPITSRTVRRMKRRHERWSLLEQWFASS